MSDDEVEDVSDDFPAVPADTSKRARGAERTGRNRQKKKKQKGATPGEGEREGPGGGQPAALPAGRRQSQRAALRVADGRARRLPAT